MRTSEILNKIFKDPKIKYELTEFETLGGCPGTAIFFKIKACSKNYRRHIVDISRIIF